MQRAIDTLTLLLLLSLTVLVLGVTLELDRLRPSVESSVRDGHVTVLEAGLTLKNLREASDEWKKASATQAQLSVEGLQEARRTMAAARTFLVHGDENLGQFLAQASAVVDAQNKELSFTQAQLRQELVEMQRATVALNLAVSDADRTIADPKIRETIANLDSSSAELNRSMAELTVMLDSGAATAKDVQRVADKVADEYTKTKNLAWALFKELLGLGSQAVQFAK